MESTHRPAGSPWKERTDDPRGLPLRRGRPAALPGSRPGARLSSPMPPPVVRLRRSTPLRQPPHRRRAAGRSRRPSQPSCEQNPRRRLGRSVWPRSRRRTDASALAWLRYTGRSPLAASRPEPWLGERHGRARATFPCPRSELFQSQAMLLARAIDGPLPGPSDKPVRRPNPTEESWSASNILEPPGTCGRRTPAGEVGGQQPMPASHPGSPPPRVARRNSQAGRNSFPIAGPTRSVTFLRIGRGSKGCGPKADSSA